MTLLCVPYGRWWRTGRIIKPSSLTCPAVRASCQLNLNRGLPSSLVTRVLAAESRWQVCSEDAGRWDEHGHGKRMDLAGRLSLYVMRSQKSHNILRESHTGELWSHNTGYGAKEAWKGYSRNTCWWKLLLCLPLGNKIYYTLCQVSILGTAGGDTCITYSKNHCKHTPLRMLQQVKRGRVANPHWADIL